MIRCTFFPPPASMCHAVGALHRLNGSCECILPGEDHVDHRSACGARWSTVATTAQVAALRIIAAEPGINQTRFAAIRESRGIPFRLLQLHGWITLTKRGSWTPSEASLTAAGALALREATGFVLDDRMLGVR